MRAALRLSDFAGAWSLVRTVEDATGMAEFRGTAVVERRADLHVWREAGKLTLIGGQIVQAERTYLWREAAQQIDVLFDDGRPFYSFRRSAGVSNVAHDCPPDTYHGRLDLTGFPDWTLDWRVSGPRKDYVSRTLHRRLAPSGALRDTPAQTTQERI